MLEDSIKEYEFSFSGCSCGCTSGGSIRIESVDKEETVKALAYMFYNNRVYGTEPFRKCCFEPEDGLKESVIERANRLETFSIDIEKIKREIHVLNSKIKEQNMAITILNIEIPDSILESQNQANETIKLLKEKLSILVLEGNEYAKIEDSKVKAYEDSWDEEIVKEYVYYFGKLFTCSDKYER